MENSYPVGEDADGAPTIRLAVMGFRFLATLGMTESRAGS